MNRKFSALYWAVQQINQSQKRAMVLGMASLFSTWTAYSHAQEQSVPAQTASSVPTAVAPVVTEPKAVTPTSSASPNVVFTENTVQTEAIAETNIDIQNTNPNQDEQRQLNQAIHQFQTDAVYKINPANLPTVDPTMLLEIQQIAQQARQNTQQQTTSIPTVQQVLAAEKPALNSISNVEMTTEAATELQQKLAQDQFDLPQVNTALPDGKSTIQTDGIGQREKTSFLQRLFRRDKKIHPETPQTAEAKINVNMIGEQGQAAENIKAKLATVTQDAFADYSMIAPELKTSAVQAAQAVGYFQSEIHLKKQDDQTLNVELNPNQPVRVQSQNIEFSGEGATTPIFRVIQVVPNLELGDILNQGLYETTKSRIVNAANEQGYFDGYWRMHDLKVTLPENKADIQLKYETGDRYKLKDVEFRMSDPKKPFPLRRSVLEKLVPFKAGDDYTAWRIQALSNNLINSRYFNSASVEVIRPDPIQRPLELPDDLKAQYEQFKTKNPPVNNQNVQLGYQQIENEQGEADNTAQTVNPVVAETTSTTQQERENMKKQARLDKHIPVIVELNADYLNSLEAGLGYGTDTGVRLRSQYRRSIVNDRGHAFDANLELSKIRQSVSGRYMLPYNHPLNDYISLLGGYEREVRGAGLDLEIESAVFGAERLIKRPLGEWQHTLSLRYRLDQISGRSTADLNDLPPAFQSVKSNPTQQSLLLGYELSKTVQDDAVNPTKGYRQFYRVEAGSKQVLTETNLALFNAGLRGLYSFGLNNKHQMVGRADLGYILTKDFNQVPYNLRYFAGGDQSIRGYDYKSLSTTESGLLIGGQILATAGVEYNYLVRPAWRVAVFSDVGNAYDKAFQTPTKVGVGAGVRWASPIGPIRVDVAAGVSEKSTPIRIHFFIGPPL